MSAHHNNYGILRKLFLIKVCGNVNTRGYQCNNYNTLLSLSSVLSVKSLTGPRSPACEVNFFLSYSLVVVVLASCSFSFTSFTRKGSLPVKYKPTDFNNNFVTCIKASIIRLLEALIIYE